jgi:hypothetical protein
MATTTYEVRYTHDSSVEVSAAETVSRHSSIRLAAEAAAQLKGPWKAIVAVEDGRDRDLNSAENSTVEAIYAEHYHLTERPGEEQD